MAERVAGDLPVAAAGSSNPSGSIWPAWAVAAGSVVDCEAALAQTRSSG